MEQSIFVRQVKITYVVNGTAMKNVRESKGMSMGALARKAGISVVFLSDVEHGRKACSQEVGEKILAALECRPPHNG